MWLIQTFQTQQSTKTLMTAGPQADFGICSVENAEKQCGQMNDNGRDLHAAGEI